MSTMKPTSEVAAGRAGSRLPAAQKIAPSQGDRPAKAIRRPGSKPLGPRLVTDAPPVSAPAVILWDEPVDPSAGGKPKE